LLFILKEKRDRNDIIFHSNHHFPGNKIIQVGKDFRFEVNLKNDVHRISKDGWIKFKFLQPAKGSDVVLNFGDLLSKTHSNYVKVIQHPHLMAPYAIKHDDAPCSYIDMKIMDSSRTPVMNCRFVETHLSDFSSVEVFDMKNNVIASSYTIGRESLPTLSQVMHPETCCIYRGNFESVFVIRSTNFDWGLMKVFKNPDDNDVHPQKILFLNLKSMERKWEELFNIHRKTKSIYYKVKNGRLLVDLTVNSISIPGTVREFPELLSLGATIVSLFNSDKLRF